MKIGVAGQILTEKKRQRLYGKYSIYTIQGG